MFNIKRGKDIGAIKELEINKEKKKNKD